MDVFFAAAITTLGVTSILATWASHIRRPTLRRLAFIAATAGLMSVAWAVPADFKGARFLLAILSFWCFTKLCLVYRHELSLSASASAVFFCVPMSGFGPHKRGSRTTGLKMLARAMGKFGLFLVYILLNTWSPDWILNISYWLWMTIGLFLLWSIISGIVDFLGGLGTVLLGIHVDDHFCNLPFLADSPRDFWSHRWNMLVKKYNHECIFQPLRDLGASNTFAALGVVFCSALAHDYFVLVGDGWRYMGPSSLFFLIHGLATVLQARVWTKLPVSRFLGHSNLRILRVVLHGAFMVFTAPLFLEPALVSVPYLRWTLADVAFNTYL